MTRQIVDLIPKIYDTQRIARIIGVDGETRMARLDPTQPEPVREVRDQAGVVIGKIYNPGVGKYDVVVTTGPSYLTKRQEAMDAMSQILQGSPQLWAVAGDLFVKNMDWPGAEELAERLRKTIDPKLLQDQEDPALQAANQQIQVLTQELQGMMQMLQRVNQSMEAQELKIKEYDAETKRISVMQAGMRPEQIQELVIQTLRDVADVGSLAAAQRQFMPATPDVQGGMLGAPAAQPEGVPV